MPHTRLMERQESSPYLLGATYFRAALRVGRADPADAIRWADAVILRDPAPPAAIFDVALAPRAPLSAVYDALAPLAAETEPLTVVRALLSGVARDVRAGRLALDDAVAVLYRMSYALTVPDPLRWEMVALEDDYALATDAVLDEATIAAEVRAWLTRFDGGDGEVFPVAA